MGVLLLSVVILSACGNSTAVSSAIGINVINRSIPAIAITLTKYSKTKIGEYLKKSTLTGKEPVSNGKKAVKTGDNKKAKPISISVSREARLV